MAVTAPEFFRAITFAMPADRNLGFYEMMQWLNDDHATETGPGWVLIAADDTVRIDTATTFTLLNSANDWSKGNANTPPDGSWCCLQTLPGNTARVWQFVCFFGSFGGSPEANALRVTMVMIPYADGTGSDPFVVPGATTAAASPAVPTLSMVSRCYTDSAEWSGNVKMCAVADENSFVFLPSVDGVDPIARRTWWVAGELENGPTGETRNFVAHQFEGPTNPGPHIEESAAYNGFARVEARNSNTTILTEGLWLELFGASGIDRLADEPAGPLDALGRPPVLPLGVYFRDENRSEVAGFFRLLREVTPTLGKKGTLATLTFLYLNSTVNQPGFAMKWDGSTAFP